MILSVTDAVLDRLPTFSSSALLVKGLQAAIRQMDPEPLLVEALLSVRRLGLKAEKIAEYEWIEKWRKAYKLGGYAPSKVRSSLESLIRRALKDDVDMGVPLPAVDLYHAISLFYQVPLGAYDVTKLPGEEIVFREARKATDRFEPLGGKSSDFPLRDGSFLYACGDEVLCYGFNHRDSAKTCLEAQTDEAAFCGEAVDADGQGKLSEALVKLAELLEGKGAHITGILTVDAENPRVELDT